MTCGRPLFLLNFVFLLAFFIFRNSINNIFNLFFIKINQFAGMIEIISQIIFFFEDLVKEFFNFLSIITFNYLYCLPICQDTAWKTLPRIQVFHIWLRIIHSDHNFFSPFFALIILLRTFCLFYLPFSRLVPIVFQSIPVLKNAFLKGLKLIL